MYLKHKISAILLISLTLTGFQATAEPNVLGTFSGTLSGTTPFLNGGTSGAPTTQSVTVNVTSQSTGVISGTVSVSPAGLSTTFDGTVDAAGGLDVSFNPSATVLGIGGFLGSFDGSTLIIPAGTGSFVIEDQFMTIYDISGTLSFSGGAVVDPGVAPGTAIKAAGTIQSEVLGVTGPIQQHLVKTLHGPAKGVDLNEQGFLLEGEGSLNAGSMQLGNVGVWASYNYRDIENDFNATAFESTHHTGLLGIDYSPNKQLVIGVALAYENSETDTTFNQGELESDGFTVSPYVGILLDDNWSLDASMGWSFITNDQFRTDPGTNTRVTSDPDTDRFFLSANLNGFSYLGNWILGGRLGFIYANSKTDGFTESNGVVIGQRRTKLGQLRVGGDIAYSIGNWEPYVSAIYEYDYMFDEIVIAGGGAQPANDRDDLLLGTGFRFFNKDGLSANLQYNKRVLREDFDENMVSFTIRYDY